MKTQLLTGFAVIGLTAVASAQSAVTFDNGNANPAATLAATTNGNIFIFNGGSLVLLNRDINLALLAGPSPGSLSLIMALTFANGGAQGDNTAFGTPGQFADLSGNVYAVPGVAGGGIAFFEVEAWLGNDATYAQALADGSLSGNSGIYSGPTGGGGIPPSPPASIGDNMPSFLVPVIPEPTTLALCGLGAASLLLFRRKK